MSTAQRLTHHLYCTYLCLKRETGLLMGTEKREPFQGDGLPLPSAALRYRVHGSVRPEGFLRVGRACARDIETILRRHGMQLSRFGAVLDFGCGCGRVLRFFKDLPSSCHLYGTDIDEQAIRWCRRHLPMARWSVNPDLPPTGYAEGFFDFVFALSVFTHLDESFQDDWLTEFRRILKPGGVALITLHGEAFLNRLSPEGRRAADEKGLMTAVGQTGARKLDGLPDYYQTTYHRRSYVLERWGRHFRILGYEERAVNEQQDAVLLGKEA